MDKQRHKTPIWSVLIICCRFWQRCKRHGWAVENHSADTPWKISRSYLEHKSHPGLSLVTGVHSHGSANPPASSSVFVRHWCTAALTQNIKTKQRHMQLKFNDMQMWSVWICMQSTDLIPIMQGWMSYPSFSCNAQYMKSTFARMQMK